MKRNGTGMDLQTGTEDTNTSEAATLLTEMGVAFFARPDGLLEVQGNINLNNRRLTSLPDLSQVIVRGSFSCMNNEIT